MLDFDVKPGKSLGEFKLGMPLPQAISFIQKNYKNIPTVELKYCEEDLLNTCILIDLVEEGIKLKFEPRAQRLFIIEVYDLTKVTLRYSNVAFSGSDINPTFVLIYSRFGPSYPGTYEQATRIYSLHYPGISFSFLIPQGHEILDETELPLEFGDGKTPTTTGMTLYHGPRHAPTLPPLPKESLYFEEVHVMVSKCIYFTKRRCKLDFYSTAQDVVSELGRPDRIYNKLEDKMRIHSGDKSVNDIVCEDYFYNYFSLGLDILFDMRSHVAKKFVLHTNFPCHYDFNVYVKCNFRLFFEDSPLFGKLLSETLSSPDVIKRKNGKTDAHEFGHKKERHSRKSVDEILNSMALDDDDDEEEEGRLQSKKRGKRMAKKENSHLQQGSILGNALMKEGMLKEDEMGKEKEKEQEVEQKLEKEEEKGTETDELGIRPYEEQEVLSVSPVTTTPTLSEKQQRGSREKGKEKVQTIQITELPRLVDPNMQWDELKELLPGPIPTKPVVNSVGASASPFGSTRFYGYKDVIFEVMRNQHVASVCLFSSQQHTGIYGK